MKTKYLAIFAMLLLVIPMAFAEENGVDYELIENDEMAYPIMVNGELVDDDPLIEIDPVMYEEENDVEDEIELIEPGILPDSPFYGLGRAIERIQMAFTFGEVNKAELGLMHAEKRLAETRAMIQMEKTERVSQLMEEYNKNMEQVRQRVSRQIEDCENLETPQCRKAVELMEHVSEQTMKHISVLQGVHEKVPEQAKAAIENAMEMSVQNRAEVMQRLETKFQEMQQRGIENGIGEPEFNDFPENDRPENNEYGMPEDVQAGRP